MAPFVPQNVFNNLRRLYNNEPRAWMCEILCKIIMVVLSQSFTSPLDPNRSEEIGLIINSFDGLFGKCNGNPIPMGALIVTMVNGDMVFSAVTGPVTLPTTPLKPGFVGDLSKAIVYGPALPVVADFYKMPASYKERFDIVANPFDQIDQEDLAVATTALPVETEEVQAAKAVAAQDDIKAFYESSLLAGAAGASAFTGSSDGVFNDDDIELYGSDDDDADDAESDENDENDEVASDETADVETAEFDKHQLPSNEDLMNIVEAAAADADSTFELHGPKVADHICFTVIKGELVERTDYRGDQVVFRWEKKSTA